MINNKPGNDRDNPETRADLPRLPDEKPDGVDGRPLHNKAALWRYIIFPLVGIFVIIGLATAFSKPLRHQLALSIVRQPTLYTQLYFTDPGNLSGSLKVGQKNIFQFTLVNDENRAYRYTYVVNRHVSGRVTMIKNISRS